MASTIKASEEKKSQIDRALTNKGWTRGENSEAIREATRYLVLSYLREKEWTHETKLNRQQLERCKLFDKKSLDKIFRNFLATTYKKIQPEIESGELKAQGISYGTFSHFLSSKPINTRAFKAYCEVLGLNWEEIKEYPPQSERKNNIDTERLSCRGSEVSDRTLALVEEYTKLFVGRSEMLELLDKFLNQSDNKWKIITAKAGFGKTALLANWVKSRQGNSVFIAYHFFSQRDEITRPVANSYRNLLQQIYDYCKLSKPLPQDENELREELYRIVKDWKDKPLVVVLDGLDEADRPFPPPFPTSGNANVFVIASARASEGEKPEYLSGWTNDIEPIHLDRLPRCAITDWLKRTGDGDLATFASDNNFVAQLDEITQGFPLYLNYLTDELSHAAKQKQDIRQLLAQTPKGFENYVKQQLKRLDELDLVDERWQFLALLAVAKGVLEKQDIKAITGMRDRNLRQLHQCWQVTRWIRISEDKFYAFAHPLLGTTFAIQLGDDAEDALEKLINYSSHWQEHSSPYALRHYAEHLRDVKHWEELYAIARNEDFYSHSIKQFPDEPDLPLKTVQTALLAAAEEDKAGEMAEFILLHARWLVQTTLQLSPLDALRAGNLNRAQALADLYDIEHCTLWYLLLVWELKDEGKGKEAREILDRLLEKNLPQLFNWNAEYAACLLPHVLDLSKNAFTSLHQQLLSDNKAYHVLCEHLSIHNHADLAIETVQKIDQKLEQVKTLSKIAAIQARAGSKPETRDILDSAFMKAKEIHHDLEQAWALRAIATAEAQAEDFTAAQKTVQEIHDQVEKAVALGEIAVLMAQSKQPEAIYVAFETLAQALNMLETIGDQPQHRWAKWSLVEAQSQIGDLSGALHTIQTIGTIQPKSTVEAQVIQQKTAKVTIDDLLKTADEISNQVLRKEMFEIIALVQVRSGNFTGAIETMQRIDPQPGLAWLFQEIASEKAKLKDFTGALQTVQNIDREWILIKTIQNIAKAQVYANQQKAARTTLAMALNEESSHQAIREKTFQAIAMAQAREFDLAKEIALTVEYDRAQAFAFRAIAVAQAQEGKIEDALQTIQNIPSHVFRWNLEQARRENIYYERKGALLEIVLVCIQANKFDIAIGAAQKISSALEKVWVYKTISVAQTQAGQWKKGQVNLALAEEIALSINDEKEQSSALIIIIIAQTQLKQFGVARLLADRIRCKLTQVVALSTIAECQIKSENNEDKEYAKATLDLARKTLQDLTKQNINYYLGQASAWRAISAAEVHIENITKALDTVREIKDEAERVEAFGAIASVQAQQGDKLGALDTLLLARDKALVIKHQVGKDRLLHKIAATQAKLREFPTALATVKFMSSQSFQALTLQTIAVIQIESGFAPQALKTADIIPIIRYWYLPEIAAAFVEIGDKTNFKKLLIPCVYYLDAAYRMCGYLARLYPEQASAVAKVLSDLNEREQ
ncbi:ATP-binding protein [Microcoleus sp. LAD1_D5]|uniref:ATP-binding protein n=1 Tax=unclassified Microcoleus TaxID=2642155 RepID=UPI002FCFFF15